MKYDRIEILEDQLAIIESAIKEARANSSSSQGLAALIRQRGITVEALSEEEARRATRDTGPSDEELSDEEHVARAVTGLVGLPDPLLDLILSGVASARPAAVARAVPWRPQVVGGRDVPDDR